MTHWRTPDDRREMAGCIAAMCFTLLGVVFLYLAVCGTTCR